VFDETHSHESPRGFLGDFEEAVQTPQPIDPGEGTFNLPALATIALLVPFFSGHLVEGTLTIAPVGGKGHDPPPA